MPEYSSTTITPADAVKVPAQNGSTSGNFQLSALMSYILASKGQANGLAGLGADGKLDSSQIPGNLDDVLVYATRSNFPATGEAGKLYITADDNVMYRWDPDLTTPDYVQLSVDLTLYATKAELAAEESAREVEDTNLKNALDATNARVENLEQEHGSYHEVDVKSVYTIPSGKAKNWIVDRLRGVGRVNNQMLSNNISPLTTTASWNAYGSVTQAINNGNMVLTFPANVSGAMYSLQLGLPRIKDHYYLCSCTYFAYQATSDIFFRCYLGSAGTANHSINNGQNTLSFVAQAYDTSNDANVGFYSDGSLASQQQVAWSLMILRDLNTYFNTTDLSFLGATDSAKLATIQSSYPWLLLPSDYGTSVRWTRYEAIKSVFVNLWNEHWANGYLQSNGSFDTNYITIVGTEEYIPIEPNTAYYFKTSYNIGMYGVRVAFYDSDKNTISVANKYSNPITSPANASYLRFNMDNSYGATYQNNLQLALDSCPTKDTYHPYHAPVTLSLSSPIELKGVGTVAEEAYLNEDGQAWKTNPLSAETNLSDIGFGSYDSSTHTYVKVSSVWKAVASNDDKANIFCVDYLPVSRSDLLNHNKAICINTGGALIIRDTSFTGSDTLTGSIWYELATPLADTPLTPELNNLLPTEAGGTIESVLTNPIDDSMTLGYLNL